MLVVRYSLAMVSGAGGGLLTTSILYRASVSDVSAKKAGMPLASFGIVPAIAQINIWAAVPDLYVCVCVCGVNIINTFICLFI